MSKPVIETESELAQERPGVDVESQPHSLPRRGRRGRLRVLKTYKLYIGGQFPRTESGRYDHAVAQDGTPLANVCRASRKDVREAVVAARAAQPGWAGRSAYNRGQILYRIAEMLEGRTPQFVAELELQGVPTQRALQQVEASVDRLVHYAGWADKVQQLFSSVNPVASSHFNFSMLEPTGVVVILAPQGSETSPLLGLVSVVAPTITGGNTCVVLAAEDRPLCAITLAEVLHSSDLPAGVVNLLTGRREELLEPMARHMDVNALELCSDDPGAIKQAQLFAAENLKRVRIERRRDWLEDEAQGPYAILDFQEIKTTWHPIGS